MIEAGAPSTGGLLAARYIECAAAPGIVMLAPPEAPRNAEGRTVKAALVEDDPVPQYNAANNTSIIKAGALRGSGPKEDGTGILLVLGLLKPR